MAPAITTPRARPKNNTAIAKIKGFSGFNTSFTPTITTQIGIKIGANIERIPRRAAGYWNQISIFLLLSGLCASPSPSGLTSVMPRFVAFRHYTAYMALMRQMLYLRFYTPDVGRKTNCAARIRFGACVFRPNKLRNAGLSYIRKKGRGKPCPYLSPSTDGSAPRKPCRESG